MSVDWPGISFKIWLETKDLVIAKHVPIEHQEWVKSISDDIWKVDFDEGFSPIESVTSLFEE